MASTRDSMPLHCRGPTSEQNSLNTSNTLPTFDALSSYFGNYDYSSPALPTNNYFSSSPVEEDLPAPDSWELEDDETLSFDTTTIDTQEPDTSSPDLSAKIDSFEGDAAGSFIRSIELYATPSQCRPDEPVVGSQTIDFEAKTFDWGDSDDDEWAAPAPMFAKPVAIEAEILQCRLDEPVVDKKLPNPVTIDFDAPMSWDDDDDDEWVAPVPMYSQVKTVDDDDDNDDDGEVYVPIPFPPRKETGFPSFNALYDEGRVEAPIWARPFWRDPLFFEDDPCLKHKSYRRQHEILGYDYVVTSYTGQEKVFRRVCDSNAPDRGLSFGDTHASGTLIRRDAEDRSIELIEWRRDLVESKDITVPEPIELVKELREFVIEPLHRLKIPRRPLPLAFASNGPSSSRVVNTTPLLIGSDTEEFEEAVSTWRSCLRHNAPSDPFAQLLARECYVAARLKQKPHFDLDLDPDPVSVYNGTPPILPRIQMEPFSVNPDKYLDMIYRIPNWELLGITVDMQVEIACEDAEATLARWRGCLEGERLSINYQRTESDMLPVVPPEQIHNIRYDEYGVFLANSGSWAVFDASLPMPNTSQIHTSVDNNYDGITPLDASESAMEIIRADYSSTYSASEDSLSEVNTEADELIIYQDEEDEFDGNKTITCYEDDIPELEAENGGWDSFAMLLDGYTTPAYGSTPDDSDEHTTDTVDVTWNDLRSTAIVDVSALVHVQDSVQPSDDLESFTAPFLSNGITNEESFPEVPAQSPTNACQSYWSLQDERFSRIQSLATPLSEVSEVLTRRPSDLGEHDRDPATGPLSIWQGCWSTCAKIFGC